MLEKYHKNSEVVFDAIGMNGLNQLCPSLIIFALTYGTYETNTRINLSSW